MKSIPRPGQESALRSSSAKRLNGLGPPAIGGLSVGIRVAVLVGQDVEVAGCVAGVDGHLWRFCDLCRVEQEETGTTRSVMLIFCGRAFEVTLQFITGAAYKITIS